jgi:hypothetical protein
MTASSIGDKAKEATSPLSPSKIPRRRGNSLGVGMGLSPPAILLNEDASSLPQESGLEPSTFRPDLLAVPSVKSRATNAAVRGDGGPFEEPDWAHDQDQRNGASPERDETLSSTLEMLMESHTPLDLSNEVVIPDYRKVAHGGIAIVYAGIWGDRQVLFSLVLSIISYFRPQVAVKVLKAHKGRKAAASWEASNERVNLFPFVIWPTFSVHLASQTGD